MFFNNTDTECLFRAYGATVALRGSDPYMLERALEVTRNSLLGKAKILKRGTPDTIFELSRTPKGTLKLVHDGDSLASTRNDFKFWKFFDTILRVTVGEHAQDLVFIHAGVVGWKGQGIVMPADSFGGKSTLVTELVKQGAEYYSDDFAIIDKQGNVRPFPRMISLRTREGSIREYTVSPEEFGKVGRKPIPVGAVVFTKYKDGGRWRPKYLTPGQGLLQMIPHTLPMNRKPGFAMNVLNILAQRAILVCSSRGEADIFAQNLLNCVDKGVV